MIEDLSLITKPKSLFEGIKSLRKRAKFYGHVEEVFFKQSYFWLYKAIKPGTVMIDIGAFIGDTTIYFAMNSNVEKVVAYEPNPSSYLELEMNIRDFPLNNKVEIYPFGISDKEGNIMMSHNYATGLNRSIKSDNGIRTVALNSVLDKYKKSKVVIKCDAEGAEYEIFNDQLELSGVYALMMEYHDGVQRLKDILESKGFEVILNNQKDKINYLCAARRSL